MRNGSTDFATASSRWFLACFVASAIGLGFANGVYGQTSSTGAVTGVTLGPSGVTLPGVTVQIAKPGGLDAKSDISDEKGRFWLPLLPPGEYVLQVSKAGFDPVSSQNINVHVTETLRLELHLKLPRRFEQTLVIDGWVPVETESAALGRVVNEDVVGSLPLVTRNFTQIAGLSPGVAVAVSNAGELGIGGTALSQVGNSNDGIFVHGSRSYANNWQLDGISVTDVLGTGAASGGIPIPNPDAIQEFKVQTGLYDAEFGRTAGANVSVVTKTGTNKYHGTIFEFLRNKVFNANDFFFKQTGQPRPDLEQNQFGTAIGGPIKKNGLFFFASYQGTRQVNGMAAGQARINCAVTLSEPPLTNDRSQQSLGRIFSGMSGAHGGVSVQSDGSNINSVALALLNFKLPDGSFLIPTPQTVSNSKSFPSRGFSAFTEPCTFQEDQGLLNVDYVASQKSQVAVRFFVADSGQLISFPGSGLNPLGNSRGFKSQADSGFVVASMSHTYAASSAFLNAARAGFVRTTTRSGANAPFKWSDVGVSEGEMNKNNELPDLNIVGSVSMATAFPRTYTQNTAYFSDIVSLLRGAHLMKVGGAILQLQQTLNIVGLGSSVQFLTWPDFLLGLDANDNGTGTFSNVFSSSDIFGLLSRDFRAWEGSGFIQDAYSLRQSLTLDMGLRYERLGQFGDNLGRNSSFDVRKADPNPSPNGSLDGYTVASNFAGPLPPAVTRSPNKFGTYGDGQNTIAPRLGFAWRILPRTSRLVARAGYGLYYSRPTGGASASSITGPPFSLTRINSGLANAGATFQAPFAQPFPTAASFPLFTPYSSASKATIFTLSPKFRPAQVQEFSLNIQSEFKKGWLLDVAYVGAHGTHLQRLRSLNQALNASIKNPVRGITVNTLANIGSRVPVPGIAADSLREMESEAGSCYNALEASLTKMLSHGLQFLASYTFSKTLDTDGANINATSAGNTLTLGDQNSPRQRWGRASFDRTHRFVISETWTLPSPAGRFQRALLGGWDTAAVVTIQSGTALTIADTNADNVFGISEDRAQLSGTCSIAQLIRGGPMQSKLAAYFNRSCFATPPIIGADGIGTAFGNTSTGMVDGPGQANIDIAFSKTIPLYESSRLLFRAEFFNALNHPQFANPDSNFTSPTFGLISSTAVNPRVGQVALKLMF